ncbi:HAD-IA family hydrolase [Schumannella luteola]|jgi:phosphoglycolate phosphatase|uniref:Phosphoglycolate phosphatase n=1 Tax=Schumannella luteola TaxID=472059 RepID=A0A852Y7P7_9MICO|nr:HAD hydrolase-like protein [Schumannella luteola]NYG97902.1 phosphoglycolate phosphatase [Schumannella luteola]TPX03045.1 HAD family hydrolase [Schumannella luteola]
MSISPYSAVLFDLDGTIADSAPGITASLAWTYEQLGRPVPTPAELMKWVGPPILDSFREYMGLDEAGARDALAIYRPHYVAHGVNDATIFPGVERVLRAIKAAGLPLSLATSKPEGPARAILDGFGITDLFDEIAGASEDETRSAKADVVEEALRRLTADGFDVSRPVLVGDRSHDIEGAAAHGVPTILVTWGYGAPAEQAGAVAVADDADALLSALGLVEDRAA